MASRTWIGQADDVELVRALFREYADALGVDLSFQGFDEELAALPAGYDAVWIAFRDDEPTGCVGVRALDAAVCELKRLYVRPAARGSGLGRALALRAIEHARAVGYERMRLDTLPTMAAARSLYRELGFVEIEPYRHNPIANARYAGAGPQSSAEGEQAAKDRGLAPDNLLFMELRL